MTEKNTKSSLCFWRKGCEIMYKKFKLALAIIFAAFFSGCGGGGVNGVTAFTVVSSTETFQIKAALTNYLTNTSTLVGRVSGTMSGYPVIGLFTVSQSSITAGTFEGFSVFLKSITATGSFVANGVTYPLARTLVSYFDSNYVPLGEAGGSSYDVVTGSVTIPVTGNIASNGNMYSENRYSSITNPILIGTRQTSYVLEPETASTALFKLIQIERDTSQVATDISIVTFRITPAGAITRLSETSTSDAKVITVTY